MPVLANNEARDFTHAFEFTAEDLNTTGFLSSSLRTIGTIPPGAIVDGCAVVVDTAFSGTSTDIVVNVGTTSNDPDEFIDGLDLDGLTKAVYNTGDVLVNTAAGYVINNTASAVPIYLKVAGTISAAGVAAGKWIVAWRLLDPARLAN